MITKIFIKHIDELSKKVSQRIAVLKKIKGNFPLAEHKLYYNEMISNGNRTSRHSIWSVIIQVITKSDVRTAGV